jgi:antitoxin VapB
MHTVRLFRIGRSQALRLPKGCEFACDRVIANRVGDAVILYPRGKGWDVLAKSLKGFTPDFMAERNQPGT